MSRLPRSNRMSFWAHGLRCIGSGRLSQALALSIVLSGFVSDPALSQPVGTVIEVPILSAMTDIALEEGGSTLLINHPEGDRLSRFDLTTGLVQTTVALSHPIGPFIIEPGGTTVLAFDCFPAGIMDCKLVRVSRLTGQITPIATGLSS